MSADLKLDGMTPKTRHKADLLFYKTPRMPGSDSPMAQNKLLLNSKREMKRSKRLRSDSTLPLPLKIWKRGKRSSMIPKIPLRECSVPFKRIMML